MKGYVSRESVDTLRYKTPLPRDQTQRTLKRNGKHRPRIDRRWRLDAAIRYPSSVRGLVLIAPNVTGAPTITHPAPIEDLVARLAQAESSNDIEKAIEIRTTLWLDGPLQSEGRVSGEVRKLFYRMNSAALGLMPAGANMDAPIAYGRLGEVSVPTLVMCGDLDLSGIQQRSRYLASNVSRGAFYEVSGTAHLPSLERPQEVTSVIADFIDQCKSRQFLRQ